MLQDLTLGRSNDLKAAAGLATISKELLALRGAFGTQLQNINIELTGHTAQNNHRHAELRADIAKMTSEYVQHISDTRAQLVEVQTNVENKILHTASENGLLLEGLIQRQDHMMSNLEAASIHTKKHIRELSLGQNRLHAKLDYLLLGIESLQVSVLGQGTMSTAIFNGSVSEAVISLSQAYPHLHNLLSRISYGGKYDPEVHDPEWLELEFHRLIDDAVTATGQMPRSRPTANQTFPQNASRALSKQIQFVRSHYEGLARKEIGKFLPKQSQPLNSHLAVPFRTYQHTAEIELPTGKLVLILTRDYVSRKRVSTIARIIFIPNIQYKISGVTATFMRLFGVNSRVPPYVSAFGIQAEDSQIFQYIKSGNLPAVRSFFAERRASPSDRDQTGHALLAVCIIRMPLLSKLS